MKNLDDIWQEYINQESLSEETLKNLIWHVEHDTTSASVVMATDMIVQEPNNTQLKKIIPYIVAQLEHEDEYVRELAISSILGRMKLPEYAEKGFKMAQEDPEENVRGLAIFSIGHVLNKIQDKILQHKIAIYLYQILINAEQNILRKGEAYRSILTAMEVPELEQPSVRDLGKAIDFNLMEKFKKKYGI